MKVSAAFFCLVLCALLAWKLDAQAGVLTALADRDPLSRAFGSAKEAFGDTLFMKADEYFHGGTSHEDHHDDSAEDFEHEGVFEAAARRETGNDWIERVNRSVRAHELMHLKKEDRKEMLPFFLGAVSLDPHNVEAVLTASFWLEREFGRAAEARALLEKGIRDNPDSWELELGLAKTLSGSGDEVSAREHFRASAGKSSKKELEKFERVMLSYELAENALRLGDRAAALAAYEEAERSFDDKTGEHLRSVIRERIKQLRGGA